MIPPDTPQDAAHDSSLAGWIRDEPGWEVVVIGSTEARPLVEEVVRAIGRRRAVPVVQLSFSGMDFWPFETVWAEEAPPEPVKARGAR